jgi:hypothetical protein
MMHALLAFSGLPDTQRDAWRTMFDHFVFHEGGTPASHIPEARRGIQGRLGEETKHRLRVQLGQMMTR